MDSVDAPRRPLPLADVHGQVKFELELTATPASAQARVKSTTSTTAITKEGKPSGELLPR